MEYSSESDEETPICESTSVQEQCGHAFPAATVAVLRAYHQKGMMVGMGRDHSSMIGEAARETGLGEEQVKRWIKKAKYRNRHMIDSEDDELPPKKVCRVTTWMQFLQTFASTDEAKSALEKGGLQEYNKVASGFYKKLSEEEKRELHEQRSKEHAGRMSKQEVRATAQGS